ncbi:divalent-cation tolerance protein CutA isoform X1 [Topomyia yanbarensis]|uniref:divalent-cation tolerance protein CutA isoform X1 n=2 Tax=Topomyia yanbarensis TaxID=2498891 RepID=UPI00273BBB10|nr:divalent-cation tolerance protein CutA isoform X1 [Topomyia yanbarensis]
MAVELVAQKVITLRSKSSCITLSAIATFVISCAYLAAIKSRTVAGSSSSMSSEAPPPPQNYEPGLHSIAYVTTPNENSAKTLARLLVERKLAACVNIIPGIMSIYEWEGKINEDQEQLLMIKTRTSRVNELSKFVRDNHPYSVAEVISVPIENGNPPYLEWLSKTIPEGKN